jgi:serine/threonine protein kinase
MCPQPLPATIGRYKVQEQLAQGGMGTLFLALDPTLNRLVALKLLNTHSEETGERFLREARSAGQLIHPNIVTVFDVGEHDGQPFIAMEYVAGETLAELMRRKAPLTIERKLEIAEQVCNGLDHAHASGLVHRDIKPGNVIVSHDGAVKILDFGIARISDSTLTSPGMMIGTPSYMSPEQITGVPVGAQSDIFSAGAVLYELTTGVRPFGDGAIHEILARIAAVRFEPASKVAPGLPASVDEVIGRAMQAEPAHRYERARDMALALRAARSALETLSAGGPAPASESGRRYPSIDIGLNEARRLGESGQWNEALAVAESLAEGSPDDPAVLSALSILRRRVQLRTVHEIVDSGRQALVAGDLAAAWQAVTAAVEMGGGEPVDALRRDLEATAALRERISEVSARARTSLERALDLQRQGATAAALRAVDEALAWQPGLAAALELRAALTAAGGRAEASVEPSAIFATRHEPPPDPDIRPPLPVNDQPFVGDRTLIYTPVKSDPSERLDDVRLVVTESADARLVGRTFSLRGRTVSIGREGEWAAIAEPSWSRRHAVIAATTDGFTISDSGSRNGTRVDGRMLVGQTAQTLFFGSRIGIGSTVFTFSHAHDTTLPDISGMEIDGRYVLVERLRDSTRGALYVARDKRLSGRVAIKLLSPALAKYASYRARFHREAELARQLHHPHVCQVLDFGPAHLALSSERNLSTVFLCLALMEGGNLADRLESSDAPSWKQIATWMERLASALDYTHRRGLVHGDVKPSAVVFDQDGNPYITDFAIAQGPDVEQSVAAGSPAYMAPEVWDTGVPSASADQFALAALAYYALTGSRPFEGQEHPEIRRRNFARGPLPAHDEARHNGRTVFLRGVSAVLDRALAREPNDRYATLSDFATALSAALLRPPRSADAAQLFFSYRRESMAGWVNYFADRARSSGLSVFVDTHNRDAAGVFPDALARAIEDCAVFVCFLGNGTLESRWVQNEISAAYQYGKPMVPVLQEGFVRPENDTLSPGARRLLESQGVHLDDRRNLSPERAVADLVALARSSMREEE